MALSLISLEVYASLSLEDRSTFVTPTCLDPHSDIPGNRTLELLAGFYQRWFLFGFKYFLLPSNRMDYFTNLLDEFVELGDFLDWKAKDYIVGSTCVVTYLENFFKFYKIFDKLNVSLFFDVMSDATLCSCLNELNAPRVAPTSLNELKDFIVFLCETLKKKSLARSCLNEFESPFVPPLLMVTVLSEDA
jgi:hypothetical protein